MKIMGFNHFQLDSANVEKTREFYEALGGATVQVMERDGGWRGYHVRLCEGATIEIQPPRLPETCGGWNGWDHIAIEVESCEETARLIESLGGRIEKQPTQNFLGNQPIINSVTYGIDGEKIEVIQLVESNENSKGIRRLSHVQVNTFEPTAVKDFYEKAFGGKVICPIMQKDGSGIKGYLLEIMPGSVLEIAPPRFPFDGKNSAWNTVAIETDDIEAAIKHIVENGGIHEVGPFKGSMGTINIFNAVMIGPAGEHIELIQVIE